MLEYNKTFDDNSILAFCIQPQSVPVQGQVQFSHNLIVNLFEKGNSPCKQEFPEIIIKRQILDHSLKSICYITSNFGIFTIEISSPQSNHPTDKIKTEYLDIEFSTVFTDYIKNIQHQNSQRANSLFTNYVFSFIYS